MLKLRIKQGKGGQWRWHLYEDDGAHAGMMTIRGVATYDEAGSGHQAGIWRRRGAGVEQRRSRP